MKEIFGDLFEQKDADAICITTNGSVKKNGEAVMGKGCALEAKKRFNGIAEKLGRVIRLNGNGVRAIWTTGFGQTIMMFPVKNDWRERANVKLIRQSALRLKELADFSCWKKIVLPRPGCGAGKLDWETEVKPILEPILDNRFYIITNNKGE